MSEGLTPDQTEAICAVMAQFQQVEEAVLFGSRARGTHRPDSDVDLALKGATLEPELPGRIAVMLRQAVSGIDFNVVDCHGVLCRKHVEDIDYNGKTV